MSRLVATGKWTYAFNEDTGWDNDEFDTPAEALEAAREAALEYANEEGCSTEDAKGLYGKYRIFRANGTPVKDRCFVLKPDKDPAAVKALKTYAAATDDEQLRNNLYDWVGEPMPLHDLPKEVPHEKH